MTARKIHQVLPRSAEAHRDGGRVHRESTAVLDGHAGEVGTVASWADLSETATVVQDVSAQAERQGSRIGAGGALESCLQELAVHNVVMDVEGSVRSHGGRASMR
ncbi:MAG TPA: hypothetical protein PKN47_21180 [Nitrospira sp.]|nr:hypothetical protein [Nitrospira sp.]